MYEKYRKQLAATKLFAHIDHEDLGALLSCLRPKISRFERNDYLIMAGDRLENIGIVLSGEATVWKENAAGGRVLMTRLKPGALFGEVVAFSNQSVWPVTVEAREAGEALFFRREAIVDHCQKVCPYHKILERNMLRILSERALMLKTKVEFLTIKSIRGKISAYLLQQYAKAGTSLLELPLNRNELADFLNVSRPSLSREMCKMRDEGIISFHLSTIKIINMQALKDMIE